MSKKRRFLSDETAASSSSASSGDDRLTALPYHLRLHILSRLRLKDAIRLSAVSSQWRDLWMVRFPHPSILRHSSAASDRPLRLPIDPSRRLDSLHLSVPLLSSQFPSLVVLLQSAARAGVQDLSLDLAPPAGKPPATVLDFSTYIPTSLSRLALAGVHLFASTLYFSPLSSFLEHLALHAVHFPNAVLEKIVSGIHLLKSLDLRLCPDLTRVVVPSTALRLSTLTVVNCHKVSEFRIQNRALRRFRFVGPIRFAGPSFPKGLDRVLEMEDVVIRCTRVDRPITELGRPCRVRVLTLCSRTLRCIVASEDYRKFELLKELQLLIETMDRNTLMDICSFFRLCCCPGLEKLFIKLPANSHYPSEEKLVQEIKQQPLAGGERFTNLKIIKVNSFNGYKYEMLLMRILLWKAICLEFMYIYTQKLCTGRGSGRNIVDNHHMLQCLRLELSLTPKQSENAKIVVKDHDDYRVLPTHHEAYCGVCGV